MKYLRRPQFRFGMVVLLPLLAWYVLFSFRPIFMSLKMAMTDYKLLDPAASEWVGLANFAKLLDYSLFHRAATNTAIYAVLVTVATIPLALVLAGALAQVVRGRAFFQAAVFLPVVVSMAAIALLFRHLYDPAGLFNTLLKFVGLRPNKFLVGADTAMISVAMVAVWKGLGGNVVILLAGWLAIPEEFYDAAKVDGANAWQIFWRITFPLLAPTLKLVAILVVIGSFQAYTGVLLLTDGGPANATLMLNQFIVTEAFSSFRFGLASAASFALLLATLVVTILQFRAMRSEWEY